MLRFSRFLLLVGLLPGAWAQQSYPFFSPSPSPPLLVTATANSPFGQSSYCYWVVVVYPIGKSTPSSPSCLSNAIETSSVLISWSAASGASSYDVLRTTTPILPNVTSNIAVATAVSGTTQTDSFGALSSYTIASAVPATANLYLDNTAFSTPQLRAIVTGVGGTSAFNLGSGGGGTPGGMNGQVQYNNAGAFGGFTVSGDATLNTGTGVLTIGNGAVTNAKLANSATTVNGQTCTLGSTCNANAGSAAHSVSLNEGAGAALAGAAIGTSGRLLIDQGAAADPSFNAVSGDATITNAGVVTVSQVNGAVVPLSAKLTSTNGSRQLVAAAAETAPITVSATGGIACATCATTTNGGALSGTSPVTISAAGVIACATCATTTNGGALSATSPTTISAAGVIACATCATTTNGGALSATSPVTISAAGVIACATCATTTNGGALSGTAPITVSAAGAIGVNISANLQVSGSNLDTIQGIQTSSTPQFTRLGLGQAADATASLAATQNGIGVTSTKGFLIQNTTAAAAGAQQFSARVFDGIGQGWKTTATAASQAVEFYAEVQPIQDTATPDGALVISTVINGSTQTPKLSICSDPNANSGNGANPTISIIGLDGTGSISCAGTDITGIGSLGSNTSGSFGVYNGNGGLSFAYTVNGFVGGSGKNIGWSNASSPIASFPPDTGLCRVSAALVGVNDGSTTCTNYRDLELRSIVSGGSVPGISGCSAGTQVGGNTGGSYNSGTTGTCTVTLTFSKTAPNGWVCNAQDTTTPADAQHQSATTTTTCTITGTTVSGDVITFDARAY